MLCLCPLDELDFDEYMKSHTKHRRLIGFVMLAAAAAAGTEASIIGLIGVAVACGGNQVYEKHAPRATVLVTMYWWCDIVAR